jgi:hypothetical protein
MTVRSAIFGSNRTAPIPGIRPDLLLIRQVDRVSALNGRLPPAGGSPGPSHAYRFRSHYRARANMAANGAKRQRVELSKCFRLRSVKILVERFGLGAAKILASRRLRQQGHRHLTACPRRKLTPIDMCRHLILNDLLDRRPAFVQIVADKRCGKSGFRWRKVAVGLVPTRVGFSVGLSVV